MLYAIAILIFLSVWALISALLLKMFNHEKPIDKIKYYDEDNSKIEKQATEKSSLLKIISSLLPKTIVNRKYFNKLEADLIKADIALTPQEFVLIRLGITSLVILISYISLKNIFIIILLGGISWLLPKMFIYKKKNEKLKLFDEQLTEGISVISNSLKAGYSFLQSMSVVIEETKDPFAKEFKKLFKEMSLGISEEDALRNLMDRIDSEDLRLMINAILIQKDIGGNLSEILDNIAETIRERQKIKNEIKTLTAQGRLSGIIVALLPVFLGAFIFILNREYMVVLFTTPIGLAMVFAAFISECFGFLMIRKIVNIEM